MSFEYRVELGNEIRREEALTPLVRSPFCFRPPEPFEKEVAYWLSTNPTRDYMAGVSPISNGFLLTVYDLSPELRKLLKEWMSWLRLTGHFVLIDNDTDEVLDELP